MGRRITRAVAAAIIAATVVVGASACAPSRPCIQGHTYWTLVPIYTGKTMTLVPEQLYACDVYAPDPTPTTGASDG